jgi:hypothetical protein
MALFELDSCVTPLALFTQDRSLSSTRSPLHLFAMSRKEDGEGDSWFVDPHAWECLAYCRVSLSAPHSRSERMEPYIPRAIDGVSQKLARAV